MKRKPIILTNAFIRPRASYNSSGRSLCDNNSKYKNVFACIEEMVYMIKDKMDCTPLILPTYCDKDEINNIVKMVDGIILPGSITNLHPSLYTDNQILDGQLFDRKQDSIDIELIKCAIKYNKPILGICRGLQAMNVALGGTLYQDINKQYKNIKINHSLSNENEGMTEEKKYMHDIHIQKGGILNKLFDTETISVNSMHKQSIKDLGKGLIVEALSDDKIIESVSLPNHKFFLGVQFHPEALLDSAVTNKIISGFLEAI